MQQKTFFFSSIKCTELTQMLFKERWWRVYNTPDSYPTLPLLSAQSYFLSLTMFVLLLVHNKSPVQLLSQYPTEPMHRSWSCIHINL